MHTTYYLQKMYNDLGGYEYNKILSGTIEFTPKVYSYRYQSHNFKKVKKFIASNFNSHHVYKYIDEETYSFYGFDIQMKKYFLRLYFEWFDDRIIFKLSNDIIKFELFKYFSEKKLKVSLVGDNELLQIII